MVVKRILALIIALLYSLVYTFMGPTIQEQEFSVGAIKFENFIICFLICSVVNLLVFYVFSHWRQSKLSKNLSRYMDLLGEKKLFLLVWGFIFLSWIPAYLIFYPGILSYDIISQVGSAVNGITDNHHPILHTWLIGVFLNLGKQWFSSYEIGLGFLSFLQMGILSYALARMVLLLKKRQVPAFIILLVTLFSGVWFMNGCLSVTMIKDTLHAAFLVLFACHFADIVWSPYEYIQKKRNLVYLPIIVFFMCAFRNNGIHIYVFCLLGLAILRVFHMKKIKTYVCLVAILLLPIFAFKIYTGPIFEMLHIEQGQVREALCIPIQQLQRVSLKKSTELSSEQRERIDYYIDNLSWGDFPLEYKYSPFMADFAKSCFYSGRYEESPREFWKFYLNIGEQFTKEYIVAALSNTLGYWYPKEYRFSYVMYENYESEKLAVPLERKSIWNFKFLKEYYQSVCSSDFWRSTPVLRLFFVPGFTIWFLFYGLALSWKRREFFTKMIPTYLPIIAQFGIMLLSPMSSFRYAWPFYLLLPLFFIGIFGEKNEDIREK